MHVVMVHVKVKPERIPEFISATRANREQSVKEPGNRRFDILQSPADPATFFLYEAYATPEDSAAHKKTAHYQVWRDAVASCMAEPRRAVPYHDVCP